MNTVRQVDGDADEHRHQELAQQSQRRFEVDEQVLAQDVADVFDNTAHTLFKIDNQCLDGRV